jgi:hypothetical protein
MHRWRTGSEYAHSTIPARHAQHVHTLGNDHGVANLGYVAWNL